MMAELLLEEKQKIYLEEKERLEAQAKIKLVVSLRDLL